jgi:putative effector of murein hydrolase LrgA (UPF0299 family)
MEKERKGHELGGLLFVACMFVGIDIGLLFGHPGPGTLIGMGIGFLVMAFFSHKEVKIKEVVTIPRSAGGISILSIGIAFLIVGIGLIFFPELVHQLIPGIALVIIGLGISTAGILSLLKR